MWWQQNACLWLNGQSVHLLKTKRTWYGGVAFRQGHWDYEAKRDPDWMGRETAVQACLPGLLRRYGLAGWHLRLLLGGPGVLWKRLSLGTPDRQEADALIAGAGLVSEEGRAYAFEAACPAKGDGGLYDWTVGAYPKEGVAAICKACHDAGLSSGPSTCCPFSWDAFGLPVRGRWSSRKCRIDSSTGSA